MRLVLFNWDLLAMARAQGLRVFLKQKGVYAMEEARAVTCNYHFDQLLGLSLALLAAPGCSACSILRNKIIKASYATTSIASNFTNLCVMYLQSPFSCHVPRSEAMAFWLVPSRRVDQGYSFHKVEQKRKQG